MKKPMSSNIRKTNIPPPMRKQLQRYEEEGFTATRVETTGKGGHFRVRFREFPDVQFLTVHTGDPRAVQNNLSRFKRLKNNQRVTPTHKQKG